MEKRRVRLEINGVVCGLITQESDDYMRKLAGEVGELMTEIQIASPYITREAAALTAALSYCDDATKNGQKRQQLQDRVDELEVEAEIWQEEKADMLKNGPAPETKARIQTLEQENTSLQAVAQEVESLRQQVTQLQDENAALRQETEQVAQLESLRREVERLQGENGRLRQAMEPNEDQQRLVEELEKLAADNAALKLEAQEKEAQLQKAEQERQSTVAAAKRAVEEAKRLVDEAQAKAAASQAAAGAVTSSPAAPAAAETPAVQETGAATQSPAEERPHRRRKNPLRHEDEFEQEGLVSFFEKK
ncbi:MAG: cell division protein ZapA [Acutalibacter sp.]